MYNTWLEEELVKDISGDGKFFFFNSVEENFNIVARSKEEFQPIWEQHWNQFRDFSSKEQHERVYPKNPYKE